MIETLTTLLVVIGFFFSGFFNELRRNGLGIVVLLVSLLPYYLVEIMRGELTISKYEEITTNVYQSPLLFIISTIIALIMAIGSYYTGKYVARKWFSKYRLSLYNKQLEWSD